LKADVPHERNNMEIKSFKTRKLDIGYYDIGSITDPVIFLAHGWPDDATAWDLIAPELVRNGYRLIIPYLRGFGPTVFSGVKWPRDGSSVALVQDIIDLADGLSINSFFVAGHDWGGRAAYQLAALFPGRVDAIAALATAYQPRGEFKVPGFKQAKNIWYQWLMMVDAGAQAVTEDPIGFARIQWDTWSPPGWYDEPTFEKVKSSFENPDWVAVTLNGYRRRFEWALSDPDYVELSRQIAVTPEINVPTLMIQGGADTCDLPTDSEGQENYFGKGYKRIVLDGIGHFPMREAPDAVATELLAFFQSLKK